MEQCGGVIDAAKETVVLVLKAVDTTILDSPELIEKTLKSDAVRRAVEQTLQAEAKRLAAKQNSAGKVTSEDGMQLLRKMGSAVSSAGTQELTRQVKSSAAAGKVKQSLKELECSFRGSPAGIFVDRNKGWLIIVASGLALAGVTAMYISKTGDWPAGQLSKLAGKQVRFKFLGNLEAGLSAVEFKPSEQLVKAAPFVAGKWSSVSAKVGFQVTFRNEQLTAASGSGEIVVKATDSLKISGQGRAGYQAPTSGNSMQPSLIYNFGLGINYGRNFSDSSLTLNLYSHVSQTPTVQKQGGNFGASYKFRTGQSSTGTVSLNAGLNRTQTLQDVSRRNTATEATVNLGLTIRFP